MNQRTLLIIGIVLAVMVIACAVCAVAAGLGMLWFGGLEDTPFSTQIYETPEVPAEQYECLGVTSGPVDSPQPLQHQDDALSRSTDETVRTLETTIVPDNNPAELADRFLGIENIPETVPAAAPFHLGDEQDFWVTNSDSNETSQKTATLYYAGDVVYFWVEEGIGFDLDQLNRLACTFETQIYPTDRDFFGSEWYPGIDNDPHIYILYTTEMGENVAGYFSSSDEIHPMATEYSNAHEMFLINSENQNLGDPYVYGVLAHEFQHMIHWYRDRNETTWINEGMSEVATVLNDYNDNSAIEYFMFDPDLQLNDWPDDDSATYPHYGAAKSFLVYFLERFGNEATQALVADPANGMDSVDDVLRSLEITDPLTGQPVDADSVVLDWMIANYLGDPGVADGRYAYNTYPQVFVQAPSNETIDDCSVEQDGADVHQYGVDYINIECSGQTTLHFVGDRQTRLLPESADAFSGDYAYWSNKGDESDMTLTRAFDFSSESGPITFSYQTWYDIETDWDYLYLLVSADNGDNWEIITTPSGTDTDPTGNSYGWGYTDASGGEKGNSEWIEESVDLSKYAGQQVLVRFEYVTDAAINGEGFEIDDITIVETGYFEDFEAGEGGWTAVGFARVHNLLPQTFRLALIAEGNDPSVQIIDLPASNMVDIPLDFNAADSYTLVVMGSTRFTRELGKYQITFE